MTTVSSDGSEAVRIQFELTRDENPRLYDDLVRFNKGTKRVNRLRFLAHEGLMAQLTSRAGSVPPATRSDAATGASTSAAQQTNRAFDLPSDADR